MEYLPLIFTVALIHLLGVMSPGPDFIMITRSSLLYSRKTTVYAALGLGCGILLHITYSLIGIGFIIAKSIILFNILKALSAAYLIYIGYKSLTAKASNQKIKSEHKTVDLTPIAAIRMGFLTNATNPKVTLFFLSLFTLVINPKTPFFIKGIMGIEMATMTFVWFAFVATLLSQEFIKKNITKIQLYAERVMGAILIALGIEILLTTKK